MLIHRLEQNSEAWRDFRRAKIGGTASNSIHPPSRGKNKDDITATATFWRLLGERVSIGKDAESEMERGHRLEPLGVQKTNQALGLNLVWKTPEEPELPGVWVSDNNESVYISPDAAEAGDNPTYAAEVKAFDTGKHLMIMYRDTIAKKSEGYNPLDNIPVDNLGQLANYFVVNNTLETVYWTLINDMVAYEHLEHYVIEIKREHVQHLIDRLEHNQASALSEMERIIKELLNE